MPPSPPHTHTHSHPHTFPSSLSFSLINVISTLCIHTTLCNFGLHVANCHISNLLLVVGDANEWCGFKSFGSRNEWERNCEKLSNPNATLSQSFSIVNIHTYITLMLRSSLPTGWQRRIFSSFKSRWTMSETNKQTNKQAIVPISTGLRHLQLVATANSLEIWSWGSVECMNVHKFTALDQICWVPNFDHESR